MGQTGLWKGICIFVLCCAAAVSLRSQTFSTVVSFSTAYKYPNWLIQGSDGNFYGTTAVDQNNESVIFKMSLTGDLTTLYTFPTFNGNTSLMQARDGNFYGVNGGLSDICLAGGAGTVECGQFFKMTPSGNLTTLYNFDVLHGATPNPFFTQGADGNFYGTTASGGSGTCGGIPGIVGGCGTVFKITPEGSLTTLYSFGGTDGIFPQGHLIQATDGNFYGTTAYGGSGNCPATATKPAACGTIFQMTPAGSVTTLYSFNGASDGFNPGNLIQATDGNFYGTCLISGTPAVFRLTPSGTLTTLTTLSGSHYSSFLFQGTDGNLYGLGLNTDRGGMDIIFELSLEGSLTTLYNFGPNTVVGPPNVELLLQASNGNLYGLETFGGVSKLGTVFEFTLPSLPSIVLSSVLNGASFQPGISADSWVTINGTNLSSNTDTWDNSIINGALPTILDGVSVMIGGQPAYIEYVSPTQINALAPSVPAGSVDVTVINANGTSQAVMAQLQTEQPAFFQWGTYAVATRQDFSLAVKNGTFQGTTTVPAKPGDVIILWGTGFGPTSPAAPAGVETPSTTTYNTAAAVSVSIGNNPATVYGAALAPGYAALYQVAIQIPASLADGDYPVVATIAGTQSPAATLITVQQ